MAVTPEGVEGLFQGRILSGFQLLGPSEDDDITEEEKTWRVLQLKDVLAALQQGWNAKSSDLDRMAEKLGDGSRDSSWREPLGSSGILEFFLRLLAEDGVGQFLRVQTLRIIGNSSADTDENRARVVESGVLTNSLPKLSQNDDLLPYVISVIFNICVDYEPAQLQASKAGLGNILVGILLSRRLLKFRPYLSLISKILGLLITQESEPGLANPATPSLLLSLATNRASPPDDAEQFLGLTSVALAYLTHEQFQAELLRTEGFELLQQAFYDSYTRYDIASVEPEEAAQLKQVWNAFVQVFADISALPDFPTLYPIHSPAVRQLVAWLSQSSLTHLQVAACLGLGNVARSDEASMALVNDVYPPIFNILLDGTTSSASQSPPPAPSQAPHKTVSTPSQLLHAALSFLKNLAIAPANKFLIGGLFDQPQSVLPRLWSTTSVQAQTQFAAISLTRLLLTGCPENVRRICAPLSADPDSPAHQRSNVHVLIDLYGRLDAEPSKLEVARALLAICRALHSNPVLPILPDEWTAAEADLPAYIFSPGGPSPASESDQQSGNPSGLSMSIFDNHAQPVHVPICRPDASEDEKRRAHFFALHVDISTPLGNLLTQKKFPTLRSELLFVLALMSRSMDGAQVALRALGLVETSVALIETIAGPDLLAGEGVAPASSSAETKTSEAELVEELGLQPQQADPQQTAGMAKVDRENGLILVAELLKNFSEFMPPMRRSIFEQAMAKGGELVFQEKSQV